MLLRIRSRPSRAYSDLTRQVLDHPGVQDHIVGDHVFIDDAHLQLLFRHSYDGVGRYLGSGPGCGGDQDDGDTFFCPARLVQKLLYAVFVGDQDAGELGRVHDAAAAAGYNEIRSAGLEFIHQLLDRHVAGLCRKIVQNVIVCSGGFYCLLRKREQAGGLDALVSEHGDALCAGAFNDGRDMVHGVFPAVNGMGHFQIIRGKHDNISFILKRLWGYKVPPVLFFHP